MLPHTNDTPTVDLTNCDREPIHTPGTIQPFGFMLVVASDWLVARASANTAQFIGLEPNDLLGRPIEEVFQSDAIHLIRNRVTMLRGPDSVERIFAVDLCAGRAAFDVALHFVDKFVVIEAEPASTDSAEVATLVRSMAARLGQTADMKAYLREGARQVRALTGFDRVMVYRFDFSGGGEVVAEALRPGVDSFLGLHYPASDIPAQARKLYLRNIFRVISDVGATPVPVEPALDATGKPLDLSLAVLRAVSPIHVEYLRNMGVEASLSISIIVDGKLWGLFACHHYTPRLPGFAERTAAELLGQMFSMMLESRERREAGDYVAKARAIADRLLAAIADDADLLKNAQWLGDIVSDTIPADGVGVFIDGVISLAGLTPDRAQFGDIVMMLNRLAAKDIYTTDHIAGLLPKAAEHAAVAAGLLAIPLSRSPRDYVVLFRTERLRNVRWAGNPEKTIEFGPNGPRLTPRKSFEEWSEIVKHRSMPFADSELRIADSIRTALLEVVLRLSDSAGMERRRAHEKQELLIAELNHRVRNILALIRGLISQTRQTSMSTKDFVETLDNRVQALARAHDQITSDRWAPARLIDLIETEIGAYVASRTDRIRLSGPNVLIEPTAFTVLALVFHELITNAAKYGALANQGEIEIGWRVDGTGDLHLSWKEMGGPPVTAPTRRGFGSTIIERSIPFDLGGTAEIHFRLSGLEAAFSLPSRFVARVLAPQTPKLRHSAVKAPPRPHQLAGACILLVEDSMIISLDGEDALRALGARDVVTAPSVARARALLETQSFDLAVLDFNLGIETSLPVAAILQERKIPFVFATGYGDSLDVPERFSDIPVLTKPYMQEGLGNALSAIARTAAKAAASST